MKRPPGPALAAALVIALLAACGAREKKQDGPAPETQPGRTLPPLLSEIDLPPALSGIPDGNGGARGQDESDPLAALAAADSARFVALEPPPETAHPIVCDLAPFAGALYASHARDVLDGTGSRIHRYDPAREAGSRWELAFDYDGDGAGGQGLPRLRDFGDRLIAIDADSTSAGFFGLAGGGHEAYLFSSDPAGRFPAIEGFQAPPRTRALRGCLHAFDAIAYGGAVVATGGTGAFGDRYPSRWPGALWAGDPDAAVLERRFLLGFGVGVVRTTYLHRFGGRLYVGFQNNGARAKFDLAVLGGDPRDETAPEPALVRVTEDGGWLTRRFASGGGALYWIASGYGHSGDHRPAALFRSRDGVVFERIDLPQRAGAPQDLVVAGDARFLLATGGLYRARGEKDAFELLAPAPPGDPFGAFDTFCSAPLSRFQNALVAGSTRSGQIFAVR